MAELQERDQERRHADQRFAASLHGFRLENAHGQKGRTYGPRHDHLQRMKQRRGIH